MSMIKFNQKLDVMIEVQNTKPVKKWDCKEVAAILKNFELQ